eukprot:CAMPEP_0119149450 /NCGR_PEP_ID=MMETSP1310-20130426/43350_1 /TAXON_ID=464262 /ORGANISM="Genus nov. species nov., Strain RCC2339" /LENGTH=190 /DNA_ID=CAMNT_0007141559 /DNA_START=30 /DNA_END=598 /DNA_ORIENTATION=-
MGKVKQEKLKSKGQADSPGGSSAPKESRKQTIDSNESLTFTGKIRHKVSADRHRFQDGKYDIDLSYITPRILAMAFPGEGIEKTWRNDINTVAEFLHEYHGDKFRVWNLTDRSYDYNKFDNKVELYGFPDHHSPPLNFLFKIIWSLHTFLKEDFLHCAAIHCVPEEDHEILTNYGFLTLADVERHVARAG